MASSLTHCASLAAAVMLLCCVGAAAQPPQPVRLAVFDIELDDYRDRASSAEQPGDAYHLLLATEALKRALNQSGQYQVVNTQPTNGVTRHFQALRDCKGCEAEVASRMGADRSLLVFVTRVSMTDYVMSYQMRDASDGRALASGSTDLRMGANYSWSRGAAWLANHKLMIQPD